MQEKSKPITKRVYELKVGDVYKPTLFDSWRQVKGFNGRMMVYICQHNGTIRETSRNSHQIVHIRMPEYRTAYVAAGARPNPMILVPFNIRDL